MQANRNTEDFTKTNSMLLKTLKKLNEAFTFETEIKWLNVALITFIHIAGVVWCYFYAFPAKWQTILFAIFMFYFSGFGVSIGAHRYWSHRSFKATRPLQVLMLIMYASAGQNSILNWVRDHRVHHKNSDNMGDPHSAGRGFFYSHIGWLMMKKHSDVIKAGKEVNLDDIYSDPLIMWQERNFGKLKLLFCFILPTLIGTFAWCENWRTAVAWQCFIRYLMSNHSEFTINSVAHMYGVRPYKKDIEPRDNWLAAVMTAGDGNHNFHHTFPYDYKSTEKLNFTHLSPTVIKIWEKLGLAYDLRVASPAAIDAFAKRLGDGSRKCDYKMENGDGKVKEIIANGKDGGAMKKIS